jgi:hypothetical protein
MKLQEKLICISILSLLVQGCAKIMPVYQSTTSKQAKMNIVVPDKYKSSVAILVKNESKYFTDYSLLYGKDLFNALNTQAVYNEHVVIDAGKELEFRVHYEIPDNQYCDFRFGFIPESGKEYWFSLDAQRGVEKNYIHNLILGTALGTCYPVMAKQVGKKFEYIKLDLKRGTPWF